MNKCPHIQLTQEIINYVLDYVTDENLLRSGGVPIELLDKAAYGFSADSIKTLKPEQLKIRWKDDLDNVKWEIEKQGLTDKQWAQYIDLSEPIDVEYWKDDKEGFEEGFYISDGHHRYYAAKILGVPLNVNLEIKVNPITKIAPGLGYDDFHRCLFKQVKEEYGHKEVSKNFLKQFLNSVNNKAAKDFIKGWIERDDEDKVKLSKKEYYILQGIRRDGKVPMTKMNEVTDVIRDVLNERLMNVDSDVDYIYDKYFKSDYDEIEKTGTLKNANFELYYIDTSFLKSPLAEKAHKLNPCEIAINKFSNSYDPANKRISISFPRHAVNFVKQEGGSNMDINVAASKINNGDSLKKEFKESTIKGSIHHELTHWIDDTLHNNHIKKKLNKALERNVNKSKNNSPINAHYMEIQSQIHNIYQLNKKYKDTWNDMSFESMINLSPALSYVNNQLKGDVKKKWLKNIKTRMHREGLLGNNMMNENIREIVKKVISESIFNEAARRIESLPKTTALFIETINSGYALSLYDPKSKKVYATIIFTDAVSPHQYQVSGVAAEPGFGPFIYELAMMVANKDGMGLMPARDGDVRGEAFNVWKKFYKRGDVKKETIPFEDEEFSFRIFDDHDYLDIEEKNEWLQSIKDDKYSSVDELMTFNTAFSLSPDNNFKELTSRADNWIKNGFDIQNAIDAADDLWHNKYLDEDVEFEDVGDDEGYWDRVKIIARNKSGEEVGYAVLDMYMDPYVEQSVTDEDDPNRYSDEEIEEHFPEDFAAKLEHLEVFPKFIKKGFGKELMDAVVKYVKERDYKTLYLIAAPIGFEPKISLDDLSKFYSGYGFKVIKDFDNAHDMVSQLREDVIEETFEGQKDLEKFTNDILRNLGDRIVKEREHMEFLVAGVEGENPDLRNLPMMFTGTMKDDGYDEIGKFVDETSIKIIPETIIGGGKETKGQLSYGSPHQNLGREIFEIRLKYDQRDLDEINELFNDKKYGEVTGKDVYFKLYYIFYSSLLHEIQHAYDAWRSKGKALSGGTSKKFIDSQNKAKQIARSKNYYELTPEERGAINNSFKEYQNLVHEINARYAQAMHRVRIDTMDDNWNEVMNPWNKVYSSFKSEFDGWINLSDKMKKKLTRRLAKAYQTTSERLQTAEERFGKDIADEVGAMNEARKIVREVIREALDSDYKKWKRKNVTLRGMGDVGKENSAGARFGEGLYTAFLGNRAMAKEYGKVYFVVGAIPKNPIIVSDANQAEIWIQYNLYKFEDEKLPNPRRFYQEGKTISEEMLKLGYDGLIIKGREMVNYAPGDIMYFDNENHLMDYYNFNVKEKEGVDESLIQETTDTGFDAYHGSDSKIEKFEDSFLAGENVIQHYGAGIYFTTNYENSRMCVNNVYKVRLDGKFIDKKTPAKSVDIKKVIALMKLSDEEWEMEAYNYNEDPETGVMIAAKEAINYADNEADVFLRVQSSWYQYQPLDYVRNMTKLGYDGMIVDAPRDWVGEKHIIVFNPEIITHKETVN